MQTFALNALAEQFEVDRSTMVRAMRNVPADLVKRGNRPTWKTATAARALEAHRAKTNGGGNGGGSLTNPALDMLIDDHFAAEAAMRALPTLDERREAARAMIPEIIKMDKVTRQIGIANGQDSELVHLRADQMLRLYARGIEGPTEWPHHDVWLMIIEAEAPGFADA